MKTINSSRRFRGTATTELVLVLPFLAFILALLIFFGRAMVRVQRAQVMDRYEAWRTAAYATPSFPRAGDDNDQLNDSFFGGNAQAIVPIDPDPLPDNAPRGWINASSVTQDTQDLAQSLLSRLPHGIGAGFSTTPLLRQDYLSFLEGPIFHKHTRTSHDWAYVNGWSVDRWDPASPRADNRTAMREVFFQRFEGELGPYRDRNVLAASTLNLLSVQPGYAGPAIVP
ncbi:MAG: pilus assembly protein [Phycisphaeraceae bacterium]|nr:pilus assembly protein [Phycisphaeraceae bacterium]